MKNKKELNKLHEDMSNNIKHHLAAEIRKIDGYDVTSNLTCNRCQRKNARKNRQKTAYVDDKSNWDILCPECQEEADENWEEMWKEYYGSRL